MFDNIYTLYLLERSECLMEYQDLRKKYNKFIYNSYAIEEDNEKIYLKYEFEINGLVKFNPTLTILKKNFEYKNLQTEVIKNIAFNIGMIEAISYYKSTCSPIFYVKCAKLEEKQIKWFKKLIYLGLGEFRYINKINISEEDFVQIISEGTKFQAVTLEKELNDVIIPIGGGKDSNVTLEAIKETKYKRYGFRINLEEVSKNCATIAGISNDEIIEVIRVIDSNLIDLNKKGFLNGHTPFSSLVAFLTYFAAFALEKKYIALSNEDSANESNIKGQNINHQYSKTFEFENDFRDYVKQYICSNGPEYFSFLRPINELQIAKLFSELEQYHEVFRSCNVGSKSKPWKWCCNCAKCLFPFIILSPFLYKEKLVKIFGEDLYEKENLLQIFIELCGYADNKPFECVGTYDEVRYALSKTIKKMNKELPFLLKYYKDNFDMVDEDLLHYYNENNNLPEEFEEILRGKIF